MSHFGDRLSNRIQELGNPSVVGLSPSLHAVPTYLKEEAIRKFDKTPQAAAEAIWMFNQGLIDALSDCVPAAMPNPAFYECFGHHGFHVYERTVAYAQEKGMLVIGDAKRGDAGPAAQAYAEAHLGQVDLFGLPSPAIHADAMTVNPYLGSDGIVPFLKVCKEQGKGIFVLVRTPNESSDEIQGQAVGDQLLDEAVAGLVEGWGRELIGESGYSSVGAMVGSVYPEETLNLRLLMPNQILLVPGLAIGEENLEDVKPCFYKNGTGALVHFSDSILFAYQKDKLTERAYAEAARAAALRLKDGLNRLF
jgi:orotidine-5'-phosphate decarboxylase